MFENFFTKTIYQKRRFLAVWFAGLMGMTILTLSFFPAFKNGELGKSLTGLSPALQKIAGNIDSFKTVGGYINQQIFSLRIPLLMTILSIVLFIGLSVGDEKKGLLETQLSLPVSRSKLLLQKLLAALLIITISSLGVIAGIYITLFFLNEYYSFYCVIRDLAGCLLVALDFGLIAFLIGAGLGKRGLAIAIASGYAFISYLITSLSVVVTNLKSIERLSLFHYQNPPTINLLDALILFGCGVILVAATFFLFSRRDITQ